jgi:hypothetical protein
MSKDQFRGDFGDLEEYEHFNSTTDWFDKLK